MCLHVIDQPPAQVTHHVSSCCCCILQYDSVQQRLNESLQLADVSSARARLATLEHDAASDTIWDDPASAQSLLTEISSLKEEIAHIER